MGIDPEKGPTAEQSQELNETFSYQLSEVMMHLNEAENAFFLMNFHDFPGGIAVAARAELILRQTVRNVKSLYEMAMVVEG